MSIIFSCTFLQYRILHVIENGLYTSPFSNLRLPDANNAVTRNGISYKPLKNDINIAVYKNASGARIDLLDKRKKGARSYILRFIEMGTQERATKKGMNRGSMKAYNFFSDAISSTKSAAESSLEQNVIAAINKVISKNKK